MIPAGNRDRRVSFYSVGTSEGSSGVEIDGARTLIEAAFASVLYGTGSERREAGQAGSMQTATVRVLSTAALRGVDETCELDFDGASWGVVSIAPVGAQQREIEFTVRKNGA